MILKLKRISLLLSLVQFTNFGLAQNWIDSNFQITTTKNIVYGISTDFAGNERNLDLDISLPTNDDPPSCGRPMIVFIHGGAFLSGSKDESSISSMRESFAQKGYVAAAVNYRLGMFNTEKQVNCNVSALGVQWNCLNMSDTNEWYRAYYRGIQDVNGAIRYLVDHATDFKMDPSNVFVVGESAGGFIALGIGFLDDTSEVLSNMVADLTSVKPPNSMYESPCIQAFNLDSSIASMQFLRPDLGSYTGELNTNGQSYVIRGVGSMYGAVFNPIFESHGAHLPALYLYHQPNDLIVPFQNGAIFSGYVSCMNGFPFNCGNIINRPKVIGSKGIYDLLKTMESDGKKIPKIQFDQTNNTAGCAQQLSNSALVGHGYDNYNLRLKNLAEFFAKQIDTCSSSSILIIKQTQAPLLYPQPVSSNGILHITKLTNANHIQILDQLGKVRLDFYTIAGTSFFNLDLFKWNLQNGIYLIRIENESSSYIQKLLITN